MSNGPERPINAILSKISQHFCAAPLDGTRKTSIIIAGAMTALPLALLVATNYGEIVEVRPIVIIGIVASLVASTATFVLGHKIAPHVAGITCGALGYVFFSMSWTEAQSTPLLIAAWLVVGLAASLIFIWLLGDSAQVFTLATIFASGAVIVLAAWGPLSFSSDNTSDEQVEALAFRDEIVRSPNVYLFVLDAFSHPGVIEEQFSEFDVDLGPSIDRLEDVGFSLEEHARTNYAETRLSVPSTLNANYPLLPGDDPDWAARIDGEPALRGHNRTVEFFTDAGYEYWHSGSGLWSAAGCDTSVADQCLGDEEINFETFSAIWENTPLRQVMKQELRGAQDPIKVVSLVEAARARSNTDAPVFLFSHLLLPHNPFRLDRNCNATESKSTISSGSLSEFRGEYAEQVICTAALLAEAMESLVAADPDAIVLLQGDHGASFTLTTDPTWADVTFRERIDIFRMTRFPDDCRYDDPAAQSLINTLPILHACLTGTEPELIEPRIFVTNYGETTLYEAEHPDDAINE